MKLKKWLALLLVLCMLVSVAACADTPDQAETTNVTTEQTTAPTEQTTSETTAETAEATQATEDPGPSQVTPLLYKVTDSEGHVVWLFGSIHVGLDTYYPLPEYVRSAYAGAEALAVECDVVAFTADVAGQASALMKLMYLDGSSIRDHIPEELYNQAVEAMKKAGLYMSMLDMYYPVIWYSFLESCLITELGAKTELGIDMHLLNAAHDSGKEILEIESAEFQYNMMAEFSNELQILLLEDAVKAYEERDEYMQQLEGLMAAWGNGDEAALTALLYEETEPASAEEEALLTEFNQKMVVDRNIAMADYAEEALKSGKEIFICVGAAHVVGEGAMADLLTQRGYTVEIVTP